MHQVWYQSRDSLCHIHLAGTGQPDRGPPVEAGGQYWPKTDIAKICSSLEFLVKRTETHLDPLHEF